MSTPTLAKPNRHHPLNVEELAMLEALDFPHSPLCESKQPGDHQHPATHSVEGRCGHVGLVCADIAERARRLMAGVALSRCPKCLVQGRIVAVRPLVTP